MGAAIKLPRPSTNTTTIRMGSLLAAHTKADEPSPEHIGFQTWHGIGDGVISAEGTYNPSVNDYRAAWHYLREAASGRLNTNSQAEAEYNVYLLWVQYQSKLRAARKNKLVKDTSASGCSAKKAKV